MGRVAAVNGWSKGERVSPNGKSRVLRVGTCTNSISSQPALGEAEREPLFDCGFITGFRNNLRGLNWGHLRQQDDPLIPLRNEDHTHPVHPHSLHTGKDCVFP